MAIVLPTRQIYPTSFLDSFRYGCSVSLKKHNSLSVTELNPLERSNFVCKKIVFNRILCSSTSNGNWIDNWNEHSKKGRCRLPRASVNYRAMGGGGGGSTMEKIVEKLKKFGYVDRDGEVREEEGERVIEKGSVEDILYVEEGMLPDTQGGFSDNRIFGSDGEARFPWEKKKEEEGKRGVEEWSARSKSRLSVAETALSENELRRLRKLTFQSKSKIKIGNAGVRQELVDKIHEKWKTSEVVKLKVEGAPALNMKRMHEILEKKTGGLVIWRSGTSISLYRGVSYEDPALQMNKQMSKRKELPTSSSSTTISEKLIGDGSTVESYNEIHETQANTGGMVEEKEGTESLPEVNYEDEVDKLLEGLGPRYTDWAGCDPLPVDADVLAGLVPGYEPPFRLLPYGVRSTLGQKEATALRRLARVLPPHFALGRNRQLQGLAVAMAKLWEKSKIAKVALKRGVQLTTSERMAEQLKKLTGGMLLSRNKDFLVFYRGKDFLSAEVTQVLLERERFAKSLQDEEEQARQRASAFILPTAETPEQSRTDEESGTAGTLGETLDADARWGKKLDDHYKEKVMREAKILRHANLVRKLEQKLALAERKLMKAEEALSKVEGYLHPAARQTDPESITDEERFMFRKLGLRMKAFLLLGRRGVFDGTVENMHLHWRYRELVKIMVKAKSFEQVKRVALALEAESGGILVSVDKVSKGYAIIVYRGKDYKRPTMIRPKNLLTKRKALARSIELQRLEALLKHISVVESRVAQLRAELEQMETVNDGGDEEYYNRLDSDYATEDEDPEDEQVDAILESNSENDSDADIANSANSNMLETNFPYDVNIGDLLTDPMCTSDEIVEDAELGKEEQTWDNKERYFH